ncbi:MAG TPA: acylphosphatase [Opitutaceae bacterium]|jgi:acylphosphatase
MPDVHHETAYYTGRVQGVGFRYAALQVAREFEVSGYVSNLPDGRVVLEAEGQKDEVDRYIDAVGEKMDGYIRKVDRHGAGRSPQFSGFSIR